MEDQQSSVAQMCRLCMQTEMDNDGFLVEIFSSLINEPGQQNLSEKIKIMFGLKIYPNDGLPSMVCHKCLVMTENCMEFRDKCLKNDEKLRLIFKVNESATEEPEAALEHSADVEEEEEEVITLNPNKLYESSDESEDESPDNSLEQALPPLQVVTTVVKDLTPPRPVQMNDATKREIYHCRFCDVVFSDTLACSSHEQSNHDRMHPYECIICSFKTDQHPTLIFHIKQSHNLEKPFLCTQCSKTFMRRSDLRKHTFVHAGIRLYSCEICKKSFTRNTNLTKHKRTHLPNAEKTKKWKCQLCPRAFFSNADLLRHMEIHLDQKSLICKHCNQAFQRRDQLELHQKTHFEKNSILQIELEVPQLAPVQAQPIVFYNQPQEQPTMNFYTENTSYITPNGGGHADYQPNQPYPTLQPKKEYPIMNQLLAGINMNSVMQPAKNYVCGICTNAFFKKKELDRHVMTVHTTVKLFKCEQCPKSFNRRDKLVRHEKIHSAAPPVYNCNLFTENRIHKTHHQHSKSHLTKNGDQIGNIMASLQPLLPESNGLNNAYNSDAMQHRMSEIMQPTLQDPPATLYPMNLSVDKSLNEPMNLSNDKITPAPVVMKIEPISKAAMYSDEETGGLQIAEDLPAIKKSPSEIFRNEMQGHNRFSAENVPNHQPGRFDPDFMLRHDQFIPTHQPEAQIMYEPENHQRFVPEFFQTQQTDVHATFEQVCMQKRVQEVAQNRQAEVQALFEPEIHGRFNAEVTTTRQLEVQARFEADFVHNSETEVTSMVTDTYNEPQNYPQPPPPAPELKPNYLIKRVDDVAFPMTSRIADLEKLESLPMEILNND